MAYDLVAYIDPGAGSLIIQAVVATIVAIPFVMRKQIARAWAAIRRPGSDGPASGDAGAAAQSDNES